MPDRTARRLTAEERNRLAQSLAKL